MTEQDKQGAEREALEAWMAKSWNNAESVLCAGPMDVSLMRNARSQMRLIEIARAALRAEQQGLEPVAFHVGNADGSINKLGAIYHDRGSAVRHIDSYGGELIAEIVPLYTHPAPASQPLKECRHCGWMCAPNAAPSKKGYPLAPASQPVGEAVAQGITALLEEAIECMEARDMDECDFVRRARAILARSGQPAQEGSHG